MNRVLLICLLVAPLIICSALTKRLKGGPVVFSRFPVERQLKETEFFKVSHLTPDAVLLYSDSLLCTYYPLSTFIKVANLGTVQ